MKTIVVGIVALGFTAFAPAAGAQSYPSRPIRVVVPAVAGGAMDILARATAQLLAEQMGQPVFVDNRGGAAGISGSDAIAKATPDGYTIGVIPDPVFTIYPHLYDKLPFSSDGFTPITLGATTALAIFVHRSVAANTLSELIALARSKPGTLSFGTPGTGSPMHLVGELLNQVASIKMVHIPYRGGAAATADAVAGQIPILISALAPALPFVKSGDLKAIAVTASNRSVLALDVPTMMESGVPEIQVTTWFGFFGPAVMPPPIIEQINHEIIRALNSPDLQSKLLKAGLEVAGGTPEALVERIRDGSKTWFPVIRRVGARPGQ